MVELKQFYMKIENIYMKIENKWFDCLDFFDKKKVPVYKIVDPIEKKGIPTMLLTTLMLVMVIFGTYFLLSAGSLVEIQITNQGDNLIAANLLIFDHSNNLIKQVQSSDGLVNLKLKQGNYTLEITSLDCQSINETMIIGKTSALYIYELTCSGLDLSSSGTFCFNPSEIGEVKIKKYQEGGRFQSSSYCGIDECTTKIESSYEYIFKTKTHESEKLNYDTLNNYLKLITCISLNETSTHPSNPQPVGITIENEKGEKLENLKIQLINPDNENTALKEKTTNEEGRVLFRDIEYGTKFKIKVLGSENTLNYVHSEIYETLLGGLEETIIINTADTTSLITVKVGNEWLGNVMISLINLDTNKIDNSRKTNKNGTVKLGADLGVDYKVTAWKIGYTYAEKEIIGGQSASFLLEKTDENKTGKIEVNVTLEGEPLKDIKVLLKEPSEIPVGIYSAPTNTKGLTTFSYVPSDAYCLTINRGVGEESECKLVEVEKGETTYININLEKIIYKLDLKIINENNKLVEDAEIEIYEEDEPVEDCSGRTLENGKFFCEIKEGTNAVARITYLTGDKKYASEEFLGKIDRHLNKTIKITPLVLEAHLLGIRISGSSESEYIIGGPDDTEITENTNPEGEIITETIINSDLIAGAGIYEAVVAVGLPNYLGQQWDKVYLEILEDTDTFEFYKGETTPFEPKEDDERLSYRTFLIERIDYGEERTINLAIPFRIKATTALTGNYSIKIKANWIAKDSQQFNYPKDGTYEEIEVTVSAEQCKTIGELAVCSSLKQGERWINPLASNSIISYTVDSQVKMSIKAIYEGDGTFDQDLKIVEDLKGSIFSSAIVISSSSVITKTDDEINLKEISLPHASELKFEITAIPKRPEQSKIYIEVGGASSELFSFFITGQEQASFVIEEPEIYDLSTSITFWLISFDGQVVPVNNYLGSGTKLTGSIEGGDFGLESDYIDSGIIDVDENKITVNFNNEINLKTNGELIIKTDSTLVKAVTNKITIQSCVEAPISGGPFYIFKEDEIETACRINFVTADEQARIVPVSNEDDWITNLENTYCDLDNPWKIVFKTKCDTDLKAEYTEIAVKRTKTDESPQQSIGYYDPLAFAPSDIAFAYYFGAGEEEEISDVFADRTIDVNVTFQSGSIRKKVPTTITITTSKREDTIYDPKIIGDLFIPLKTTSYINPICDSKKYCTLEQFFKYIKTDLENIETFDKESYTFNLLANEDISINEFAALMKTITGLNTIIGNPDESITSTTSMIYIKPTAIVNTEAAIKPQKNKIEITKNIDKNYFVINSISRTVYRPELESTIMGLQLHMPYTEKTIAQIGPSMLEKSALYYEIQEDNGIGETPLTTAETNEIKSAFNELTYTMYSNLVDIEKTATSMKYSSVKTNNNIILGVCNKQELSDENPELGICGKFKYYSTGTATQIVEEETTEENVDISRKIDSLIVRDSLTGDIYFLGKSKENLIDLIKALKRTIFNIRTSDLISQELDVKTIGQNTIIVIEGAYDFKYYCEGVDCTNTEIQTELDTFAEELIEEGKEIIETDDIKLANLIILNTNLKQKYTEINTAFKSTLNPDISSKIEIPDNGYYFQSDEGIYIQKQQIVLLAPNEDTVVKLLKNKEAQYPTTLTMVEFKSLLESKKQELDIGGTEISLLVEIEEEPDCFINNIGGSLKYSLQLSYPVGEENLLQENYNGQITPNKFDWIKIIEVRNNPFVPTITPYIKTSFLPATYLITLKKESLVAENPYTVFAFKTSRGITGDGVNPRSISLRKYCLSGECEYANIILAGDHNYYNVAFLGWELKPGVTLTNEVVNYNDVSEDDSCVGVIPEGQITPPSELVTSITLAGLIKKIWESPELSIIGPYYITDSKLSIKNKCCKNIMSGGCNIEGEPIHFGVKTGISDWWVYHNDRGPCDMGCGTSDAGDIGNGGGKVDIISWNEGEAKTIITDFTEQSYCLDIGEYSAIGINKGQIVEIFMENDFSKGTGFWGADKWDIRTISINIMGVCPIGYNFEPAEEGITGGSCVSSQTPTETTIFIEPSNAVCKKFSGTDLPCWNLLREVIDTEIYNQEECGSYEINTLTANWHCAKEYFCVDTVEVSTTNPSKCCPIEAIYDSIEEVCYIITQ